MPELTRTTGVLALSQTYEIRILYFNKVSKWLKCTLKCEKYQPTGSIYLTYATHSHYLSSPFAIWLSHSASLAFLLFFQCIKFSPIQGLCTYFSLHKNVFLSVSLISLPHLLQTSTHENFPSLFTIENFFSGQFLFPTFYPNFLCFLSIALTNNWHIFCYLFNCLTVSLC